ncbi:MAG TPA: autotransporter domain-containing protein [bacterium]|nr:autotransporter domain-containing protein [bacterium]
MAIRPIFPKLALLVLIPIFVFSTANLFAQTNVTTNAGDESNGSLGWAVTTLNNAGAGAISIANVGPITLTQPLPTVSQTVTFLGVGMGVIGQDNAQSQFLFQQGFTLGSSAALTFTDNGALSSGLDAALTAASWNLSSNSSFAVIGGNGGPQTAGGGAFITWGTASAASGSGFLIQGGSGGVSSIAGDGGEAAVTAISLSLSGAHGTLAGGAGGDSTYQNGNGGSATLSLGSLNMDTAAQLGLTGGDGGVSTTGGLGNGGNAVITANSVSLTGTGTQLNITGGTGGGPTTIITEAGPADAGNGGIALLTASSVTVDSQAQLNVKGGAGGSVTLGSSGSGGNGGSVTVYLGELSLTNGGSTGVTSGAGGQGFNGSTGGSAFVTVGSLSQGTGSTLSLVSGAGGGSSSGGNLNFIANSQTLASGATFIAVGGAGGSGMTIGGDGGAVQVYDQALTLSSGSLWELQGGTGGTGTSSNGSGSAVLATLANLQGSGTVSMGGPGQQTLQLISGNFSGVLEGTEGLDVEGYGVVTLTGNNAYTGGTTVSFARLIVGSDSNLGTGNLTLDGGTLEGDVFSTSKTVSLTSHGGIFDSSIQAVFNGVISGPGGLQLTGGGLFGLNAVNTYTGPTTVLLGFLDLTTGAQIAGSVTVANNGDVVGTGTVSGAVTNNGVLTAGYITPYGTLTVGSYTQGSTGYLEAILSPSQSNLLVVNGLASLDGSLAVSQTAGTYSGISYRYIVLSAGSITGIFSTSDDFLLPNWNTFLGYGSNAVTLALYRTGVDFTPLAMGANQTAVAQALNAAVSTGNFGMAAKLNEFYALPSGQGAVLGQLTGDIYAALPNVLLDNVQFEDSLLFDRLDGNGAGMAGVQAPSKAPGRAGLVRNILSAEVQGQGGNAAGLASPGVGGLWVENTDSAGFVNGDGNMEGLNKSNYGFLAGYDTEFSKGFTGGVMGGYVHTDVNGTTTGDKVGVDGIQFGAYGSKKFGPVDASLVVGYSLDHFTANRAVSIGSDVTQLAGAYDGNQIQAALQGAYDLGLSGFTAKPLVGVEYAHLGENAFTETGSDSLALAIPAQSYDSVRPYLGVEGTKAFILDQDLGLIPRLNLSVSQELITSPASYQAAFNGAPNNPFTVKGVTPSATTISMEAGTKIIFGKQFNLFANYQGHFSGTQNLNTFNGGLDIAF